MSTYYTIQYSDPANGSFQVPSDSINGTTYPWNAGLYTNPVSGLSAVTSNTSLVLAGRGITDYGELVQNNLVYLMEHFAYQTRPLTPVQGQIWYKNASYADPSFPSDPTTEGLYIYDGVNWSPILMAVGGNIDMGGAKIVNLGNATTDSDALNRQTGDARYLRLSGGTVTGGVTFTSGASSMTGGTMTYGAGVAVSVTDAPTTSLHVANKDYVDAREAHVTGLLTTETNTRIAADNVLANDISTINGQLPNFVQVTGDTMSGSLTLDLNAGFTLVGGGSGAAFFGLRRLQQLGTPIANEDATTKLYVDTAITAAIGALPPASVNDGVVYQGNFNPSTGVLTLNRTLGLPDVVITGTMAPFNHGHSAGAVTYNLASPLYSQSLLITATSGVAGYPTIPTSNAFRVLDQRVSGLTRHVKRRIMTGDGTTTSFDMGTYMEYDVGGGRLMTHIDGVKLYCSERGQSIITFTNTPINAGSAIGIAAGSYQFTITVDGVGPTTVTINPTTGFTYLQLANALVSAFTTLTIPVNVRFDSYYDRLDLIIESNTVGNGSSVTVSYTVGSLFEVMPDSSAPVNSSVTVDLGYEEVGLPGDTSTTVLFNAAPALGATIEFSLLPI